MKNIIYTIHNIVDYRQKLTHQQANSLVTHCNKYQIYPNICAWYVNLNDFYSVWCNSIGYTRSEALDNLYNSTGEFKIFDNGEIVRLVT